MESSFHSGWNGMAIPFRPEWNGVIPFRPEWNELSIPAGMDIPIRPEWNATPSIILRNMPPGPVYFQYFTSTIAIEIWSMDLLGDLDTS